MTRKSYNIWGLMESPRAISHTNSWIAEVHAAFRFHRPTLNLRGFIFGAEDYAAEMGITRSPSMIEMLYARQHIAIAAKSRELEAIDLVKPRKRHPFDCVRYVPTLGT
jgi:citrate lyase beta subunit